MSEFEPIPEEIPRQRDSNSASRSHHKESGGSSDRLSKSSDKPHNGVKEKKPRKSKSSKADSPSHGGHRSGSNSSSKSGSKYKGEPLISSTVDMDIGLVASGTTNLGEFYFSRQYKTRVNNMWVGRRVLFLALLYFLYLYMSLWFVISFEAQNLYYYFQEITTNKSSRIIGNIPGISAESFPDRKSTFFCSSFYIIHVKGKLFLASLDDQDGRLVDQPEREVVVCAVRRSCPKYLTVPIPIEPIRKNKNNGVYAPMTVALDCWTISLETGMESSGSDRSKMMGQIEREMSLPRLTNLIQSWL